MIRTLLTLASFLTWALVVSQPVNPTYSFFTAGHTYGNPNSPQYGLYPPFMNKTGLINGYQGMAFGCLTGDVVVHSTAEYWDAAQADMEEFSMPLYIAAGNHDMGPEFVPRFGNYYFQFTLQGDLFITLVPGLGNWNITGEQKDFLVNTLDSYAGSSNRIFVFLHELIWWSPDSIFQEVVLNYAPNYPGSTNFWTEIEPLFHGLSNPVVFYAGDLGCTTTATPFMYHAYDNITLIASGMGGGLQDNFIITDVFPDTLVYHLIALNGDDINALGELTAYSLGSQGLDSWQGQGVTCHPNPFRENLYVDHDLKRQATLQLLDWQGIEVTREIIHGRGKQLLRTGSLPTGIYFLRILYDNGVEARKLVKF